MIFCAVHLCATLWWIIPAKLSPLSAMEVQLPEWFQDLEHGLINIKSTRLHTSFNYLVNSYVHLAGTHQSWRLFAPNPSHTSKLITVYAVTGWTPNVDGLIGVDRKSKAIYDPLPLFQSYDGRLEDFTHDHALLYDHRTKLAERLEYDPEKRYIPWFANYWGRQYKKNHGHFPLAIHVVATNIEFNNYLDRNAASVDALQNRIIWHVDY